jgi:NTP pyrophosphatase (non-canonical NTP hydrolase)
MLESGDVAAFEQALEDLLHHVVDLKAIADAAREEALERRAKGTVQCLE